MRITALLLLKGFARLNGFNVQFDSMTTLLGSNQDMIVLHRAKKG